MSPSLPTRPSLDHLKKQAKCLLRAHRSGNTQACRPLRERLPRLQGKSDDEILAARITLHDAQYAVAREHGFEHWPALRQAVLESGDPHAAGTRSGPVPTMGRLNDRWRRHIESLGFATVGAYRIWCHREGLGTALDKSEEHLRQELKRRREHPPAPAPRPGYRPSQARLLTQAYHGHEEIWDGWKQPYEGVADDAERAALHRLLIHCERCARVSGPFVWQLARHHRDWLRPVEEWYPRSQNPRQQLRELTRHLLGRDDLPSARGSQGWCAPDRRAVASAHHALPDGAEPGPDHGQDEMAQQPLHSPVPVVCRTARQSRRQRRPRAPVHGGYGRGRRRGRSRRRADREAGRRCSVPRGYHGGVAPELL